MVAFWRQNFVPNNAALVVAGEISMSELRALAERRLAGGSEASPRVHRWCADHDRRRG
jgi:predicted Zn-dependent peptidase